MHTNEPRRLHVVAFASHPVDTLARITRESHATPAAADYARRWWTLDTPTFEAVAREAARHSAYPVTAAQARSAPLHLEAVPVHHMPGQRVAAILWALC